VHYQGGRCFLAMVSHVAAEHKRGPTVTLQCVYTYWPALHHWFKFIFLPWSSCIKGRTVFMFLWLWPAKIVYCVYCISRNSQT